MYDFKKFLFQTDGESAFLFWLDVERLRLANQTNLWIRKVVIKIFSTYINNDSPFQLGTPSREYLVKLRCRKSAEQVSLNLKQSIKELIICQKEVLQRLRTYWCQRYVSKIEEEGKFVMLGEQPNDKPGQIPRIKTDMLKPAASPYSHQVCLPTIIVDRRQDTVAKTASYVNCHDTSLPHVPEEVQKITRLAHAVSNHSFAKMAHSVHNVPSRLISSSTYNLFSDSSATCSPCPSAYRHRNKLEQKSRINLKPFLCAALRADFVTGNHFLRYLKKVQPNPQAVSYMLFWQSIEIILTQDEMRRWFYAWSQSHVTRKTADGGSNDTDCPYLSYFEPYFIARNLKELCQLFLCPTAMHRVQLPDNMEENLELWVRRGLGQGLLLEAQKYAAQVRYYMNGETIFIVNFLLSILSLETDNSVDGISNA